MHRNRESLQVGETVEFEGAPGGPQTALVTAIHGAPEDNPAINLVYVSPDEGQTDTYGRVLVRETSVAHEDHAGESPAKFWR